MKKLIILAAAGVLIVFASENPFKLESSIDKIEKDQLLILEELKTAKKEDFVLDDNPDSKGKVPAANRKRASTATPVSEKVKGPDRIGEIRKKMMQQEQERVAKEKQTVKKIEKKVKADKKALPQKSKKDEKQARKAQESFEKIPASLERAIQKLAKEKSPLKKSKKRDTQASKNQTESKKVPASEMKDAPKTKTSPITVKLTKEEALPGKTNSPKTPQLKKAKKNTEKKAGKIEQKDQKANPKQETAKEIKGKKEQHTKPLANGSKLPAESIVDINITQEQIDAKKAADEALRKAILEMDRDL